MTMSPIMFADLLPKMKQLDSYRNAAHDIKEAKEHMRESYDREAVFTETRTELPVEEILDWDDYGSWGQWQEDELRDLSRDELIDELANFRGRAVRAATDERTRNRFRVQRSESHGIQVRSQQKR